MANTAFINKEGDFVIDPRFSMVYSFSHGLAAAQEDDGSWGYINQGGSFEVAPQFEEAFGFSEELARVKVNGKWGYITIDGKIAIEPQFDVAYDFREGLARVEMDGKKGFIRYTPPTNKELIIDQPKADPLELTRREIKDGLEKSPCRRKNSFSGFMITTKSMAILSLSITMAAGFSRTTNSPTNQKQLNCISIQILTENYLLLYAENLGKIPPCTAAISIDDNHTIEKVILNSDLNQCDIIYFQQ